MIITTDHGREALRIDPAGNVGIAMTGTTDPSTKLEVQGQTYINNLSAPGAEVNQLSFNEHGQNWGHVYGDAENRLYFGASDTITTVPSSPIMTWDLGTSNVGIGLRRPGAKLEVDGDIRATGVIVSNADCAEEFDIAKAAEIEPGTVMVIDQEGALHHSCHAYDKRVAGVISGAGGYQPGLILDRQQSQDKRVPIALVGKVYCKVDAEYAPIDVGDLLTTSPTPGHAMKADDPLKAFGSVIGKALRPLKSGREMIPILIALQ
ncbi:MAG: hypothetical protein AUI36_03335 [Cyanobacteria bacterium 13_1_40CM_2_61_4]|nr:MAG: hypothetical protein AUI36_03335 [Cyanobacteria bacterium 13_1_40CM_2_61_4]